MGKNLIFIISLCLICGAVGYYFGSHEQTPEPVGINVLEKKADSLQGRLNESVLREKWYLIQMDNDSAKIQGLLTHVIVTDTKIKHYEKRLKDLDKVVITNLDSFFISEYPMPDTTGSARRVAPGVEGSDGGKGFTTQESIRLIGDQPGQCSEVLEVNSGDKTGFYQGTGGIDNGEGYSDRSAQEGGGQSMAANRFVPGAGQEVQAAAEWSGYRSAYLYRI